jgi:glutamate-1-semialdehyde 2,1-aminomutase
MAVAVRIARAATGRDIVAFCGYHGWNDWYLAANLMGAGTLNDHLLPGLEPAGVPHGLAGTALPFRYNRLDELEEIVDRCGSQVAAIVMEPTRGQLPKDGFLETVRAISNRIGAVLVFDEVTSGFRVAAGGVHLALKVMPDVAVFAKAIGNGYPMAAVIGRQEVMQAAQRSFISSTYWTERIGPVAALATIRKFQRLNVADHLVRVGAAVKAAWIDAAAACGLPIRVSGLDPLAHFEIEHPDAQSAKTLYTQEMLQRGFLANNAFYAMMAHTPEDVQAYGRAAAEVLPLIQDALREEGVRSRLKGPVSHLGFSRLA